MHTSIARPRPISAGRMPPRESNPTPIENPPPAVRQLTRELERRNRMVAVAAHELRSPLSSIRGLSEFLKEGAGGSLTPTQQELLNVIHETSQSLLGLVDELLDLSSLSATELKLRLEPHDVVQLVAQVVATTNLEAAEKQSRVQFDRLRPPVCLMVDAVKFAQIVRNLLSNAIKYSPPGATISVGLFTDAARGFCQLSVRDQGPGIPAAEHGRLFEAFGRLSTTPTSGEKSTGLGLAICRRIVEAHRGCIEAENVPGGGCEFRVTLPLARQSLESPETSASAFEARRQPALQSCAAAAA